MYDIFYYKNKPKEFPQAIKLGPGDNPRDLAKTRYFWILNGYNDYSNFDILYEPKPWEADQKHIWPSQHQDHGGTELVPRKWDDGPKNYNHKIVRRTSRNKIVWIDFGNSNAIKPHYEKTSRFNHEWKSTLDRVLKSTAESFIWVTSSVCDYRAFDFTWHPNPYEERNLHVFASDEQKFGDTFYINVNDYKLQRGKLLEWYDVITYHKDISVPRRPLPVINHDYDSQVDAVKAIDFDGPLALYSNNTSSCLESVTVNLWREKTRTIVPLTKGGSCVIVPKDARNEIKTQLYDYKYIDKNYRTQHEPALDIVFMSNGEANAEEHYNWLKQCTKNKANRVHHISNVDGRLASMRAAAKVSHTEWFFVVNAKLFVDKDFDWNWQPDRLQEKKHYIFYADNPYTGDRYGHMATVCYNKQLVNTDVRHGLDFTMSYETAVVPILSGEARYGNNDWDAWRTAFRETLKLITSYNETKDLATKQRINKWLQCNDKWNLIGATDAKKFYNEVNGEMEEIKNSYEWKWLKNRFNNHYSN